MISFALTTHNEGECIRVLIRQMVLLATKPGDEIVVMDDFSDDVTSRILEECQSNYERVTVYKKKFEGHFADHKNHLNSLCTQDWIFQIDADEILDEGLSARLHALLGMNQGTDLIFVPRVNTVEGLTEEDIANFSWNVNDRGWVMWPDYQGRIYRNTPVIRWEGKVHEKIVGAMKISFLPEAKDWAIIHTKDVNRQREQNALYDTLV